MFKREDVIVEPEYYLRGGIEVFCPDCRRVLSKGHWTVCVKIVRDGDTSCLRLVRAKLDPPPSFNKSFDTRLTARKTRES